VEALQRFFLSSRGTDHSRLSSAQHHFSFITDVERIPHRSQEFIWLSVSPKPFKLLPSHAGKVRLRILFIVHCADVAASRHYASTSNILKHVVGFFDVPQLLPQSTYSNERPPVLLYAIRSCVKHLPHQFCSSHGTRNKLQFLPVTWHHRSRDWCHSLESYFHNDLKGQPSL
jgi:hypothetical protein